MEKLLIEGGTPLNGKVTISGAKNAAVAILPATVLVKGKCRIDNLPNISDIHLCCEILSKLGAKVSYINDNEIDVDCTEISSTFVPLEMARRFRASYYFLGSLLGRFHTAEVGYPGGCNFGSRPIDQHIKGFELLGAEFNAEGGIYKATTQELNGNSIYLDVVSVGATINIMLASVLANGITTIENAAKEPHIVDLANFLNTMGANIKGAGTDVIKITGVPELKGNATYSVVPDQIEAGTFMIAAAASRGNITITNCITKHLEPISAKLEEMGISVIEGEDGDELTVSSSIRPTKANIKTSPYPGFPTDMQPQAAVLLSIADGRSSIYEGVFDSRFQYVEELRKFGVQIDVSGKIAYIEGVEELKGCPVVATDLRAGAALIIAGIIAKGTTEITGIEHIDRGYENIEEKLKLLGARIKRIQKD